MASDAYGSLPFREQAEFFRRKINLPTSGWSDVYAQEHDVAFMVAGANRDAIVTDFRGAVDKAINDGTTLEEFRQDFDAIVAKHGWDYNGGRNWRSRVIYDTNLTTSYAAGVYEQLQSAPFWEYEHQDWVEHPRPQHVAWNGLTLAKDDPWWQTHFPPNGWGCNCTVRGRWLSDLQRAGKSGPDQAPPIEWQQRTIGARSELGPREVRVPAGIDPGFEYAPGASRLRSAIPMERPDPPLPGSTGGQGLPNLRPNDPLPAPRTVGADRLLPAGLPPESYVSSFLSQLGASASAPTNVRDAIGERLVVGPDLFQDTAGEWKVLKRGRERFLGLLADTLQDPDEIWVRLEWLYGQERAVVRRRYIARFAVEGLEAPALLVFERGSDGWAGVTGFAGPKQQADDWRIGVRLYRREDGDSEAGNE